MKTCSLRLVAGTACLLASQAVNAADPVRAPSVPVFADPTWAGFYFGGQSGSIIDRSNRRQVISGDGGPVSFPTFGGRGGRTGIAVGDIDDQRVLSGVHAGYNGQWANTVFGVEADLDSLGPLDNVLGSARLRLGYGGPAVLLYGTAGVAFLSQSAGTLGVFVGGNGGNGGNGGPGGEGGAGGNGFGTRIIDRAGSWQTAFVGGLGAEVKLSPQVGAGVEALYYSFDKGNGDFGKSDDFFTVRGRLTFHLDRQNASAPVNMPGMNSAVSWAGLYGGGHVGAVYNSSDRVIDDIALANGEAGTAGVRGIDAGGGGGGAVAFAALHRSASVIGGVHLGYNWQSYGLVYGAEADASFSPDDSHTFLGSARGRLGWAHGTLLLYGTAGVAFGRNDAVNAIFAENGGGGGNGGVLLTGPGGPGGFGGRALAFRADNTQVGLVVGGGLEAKVSDRVSLGLEGLYYRFDDDKAGVPAGVRAGRAFLGASDNDAFVLGTRLSFHLQP